MTDDKIWVAIIAAASAIIGGAITAVLGPWIKHHWEQNAARKARQREQLQKWRQMLLQVEEESEDHAHIGQALQAHPDYMSLEPYLSEETKRSIYRQNYGFVVGHSLLSRWKT